MSNTPKQPPSNASTPLNSTRQLLDELDALMKRMLELPVGESAQGLLPDKTQTSALLEPPPQDSEAGSELPREEEAFPRLPIPSLGQPFPGYHEEPETSPGDAPEEPEPENLAQSLMEKGKQGDTTFTQDPPEETAQDPELTPRPILEKSRLAAHLPKPRRKWWFPLLTAINWTFDLGTHILGPLGSWLRQPRGRTVLGIVGLALLLAALTWQILLWTVWQ